MSAPNVIADSPRGHSFREVPDERLTALQQFTYGPRLTCQVCDCEQRLDFRPRIDAFVRGDPVFCDRCDAVFDVWEAICGNLKRCETASHVLGLAECETVVRGGYLSKIEDQDWVRDRRITISFSRLLRGTVASLIPTCDPSVLRVDWRTQLAATRSEPFAGRFSVLGTRTIPDRLDSKGVVLEMWPKDADVEGVWFECACVWVDRASEWRLVHLADAFSAHMDGFFADAVPLRWRWRPLSTMR